MSSTGSNHVFGFVVPALLVAALSIPASIEGQEAQGTVTGQVVDAAQLEPVSGAQVFIPGTDLGSLTDEEGRYTISGVPPGQVQVRVRLLGYRPANRQVSVEAGETVTVDFELPVAAVALEEVVVTATGERRNREVGNSISTVNAAEQVERKGSATLADLLQGESTGVTVRRNSGTAGAASTIRIRGNSSISLDNTPLVYVDGARIANGSPGSGQQGQEFSRLNDIRPEDIESIEVVKGPAAATLYGTAAATGVIRITTKKGSAGRSIVTLRGGLGANWDDTNYPPSLWSPRSFFGDAAKDTLYSLNLLEAEEPFRTGTVGTAGASIRGGVEDVTYYVSGAWTDEQGVTPNNRLERWNLRGNVSFQPYDFLDVDVSNGIISNFAGLPDNDNNIFGYIPIALVAFPWTQPLTRDGIRTCPLNIEISRTLGVPLSALGFDGCAENPGFGGRTFEDLATRRNEESVNRYVGSATATFAPLDWLNGRYTVGYDEFTRRFRQIVPVDPSLIFGDESRGFIQREDVTTQNVTLEGNVSADLELSEALRSRTTVGVQWNSEQSETTLAIGRNFPAGSPSVGTSVVEEADDAFVEVKTLGAYVQQQFSWRDRIFLTPGVRIDDNSAFGAETGVQDLKQINASYVVSDEEGFPEFFQTLRLRAAWGESAKQPGTNDALTLLEAVPAIDGGAERSGVLPARLGNVELEPETGEEFEAGFDATILDGRLNATFTYYDQTTRNAIVQKNLAPSKGFPDPQFTNIGEMVNRGIEASLEASALDLPNLRWDWRFIFTTNDNEITELDEPIVFDFGNSSTNGQRHEEGRPFGAYVHRPVTLAPDGSVQVGDSLTTTGHPTPEWEGSVSTTLSLFNHVTLFGLLDFQGGHQLFNNTAEFRCNFLGGGVNGGICPDIFERGPDGEFTDEARLKQVASALFNESPFVEDADFARIRTVSLRFDAPSAWSQLFRASSASLTLVLENAGLFTGYGGLDPEANEFGDTNASRGEFLTQPPNRRFQAMLSLTF